MPSLVTHHHFAAMVEQAAPVEIQHAATSEASAYRWGAQGPDVLFFHNAPFGSRTALLGHRMHATRVAESFTALVRAAVRQKTPAALSYVLGFCTHYVLDRRAHPYIEDTINTLLLPAYPQYDNAACHRLCEAALDTEMILKYISCDAEHFEAFRLLDAPPANIARMIGRLLTDVAEPVYHIETAPARVEASMRTMRLVYTILHGGGNENVRGQIEVLERMFGKQGVLSSMLRPTVPLEIDCANNSHRVWHKAQMPTVARTESFFDLLEDAIAPAIALQRAVYQSYYKDMPLNALFFPANYDGLEENERAV